MFCTGGIRCEKASSYMLGEGFEEVFSPQGAASSNTWRKCRRNKTKWQGDCFVFDNRVTVRDDLTEGDYDHVPCLPYAGFRGGSSVELLHPRCQLPALLGFAARENPCRRSVNASGRSNWPRRAINRTLGLQPSPSARGFKHARAPAVCDGPDVFLVLGLCPGAGVVRRAGWRRPGCRLQPGGRWFAHRQRSALALPRGAFLGYWQAVNASHRPAVQL